MRPTPSLLASVLSKPASKLKKVPPISLDHFLQRQRVISLYREIARAIYRIPPSPMRVEMLAHARGEFERNRHVSDLGQIRYLISTGKTEFGVMRRYVEEQAAR